MAKLYIQTMYPIPTDRSFNAMPTYAEIPNFGEQVLLELTRLQANPLEIRFITQLAKQVAYDNFGKPLLPQLTVARAIEHIFCDISYTGTNLQGSEFLAIRMRSSYGLEVFKIPRYESENYLGPDSGQSPIWCFRVTHVLSDIPTKKISRFRVATQAIDYGDDDPDFLYEVLSSQATDMLDDLLDFRTTRTYGALDSSII